MITILLADDHPLFRKGLREVIEEQPGLNIIKETGDGSEALQLLETMKPNIAILDIEMPGMNGLDVALKIQQRQLPVDIIMLTMHDKESFFNSAMDAGAMGYVLKNSAVSDILDCVQSVHVGKYYISPSISSYLMNRAKRSKTSQTNGLNQLTDMERTIMRHVADGKSTKDIAGRLCISTKTVETHRHNICTKLDIHGTNALLRFALEHASQL
ncbi:MAG: response regulator transcription factor [Ignavibacteriae bacterium]|nr:response regulator transcription factor [Ignavibacteriota bacterium]